MKDKLVILSTIYDNVERNTDIDKSYRILLEMEDDLDKKIIDFINVFIEDEKRKLVNRYKKNGEILCYLGLLKEAIENNDNVELPYLRAVKVYPKLRTNFKDYIKYLMQQEIDNRLSNNEEKKQIIKDIHPEVKKEIYGRR